MNALAVPRKLAPLGSRRAGAFFLKSIPMSDNQRAERITDELFGPGIDSASRCEVMLRLLAGELPEVFWAVFLDTWTSCDDTWKYRNEILDALREARLDAPASDDGGALLARLPDRPVIYRGCSASRIKGVSWTIDRDIAAGFAGGHRGIRVPDPVIAEASIPLDAVFCTINDRNESELVIDPDCLLSVAWTA